MQPYEPRPIRFHGVRPVDGWRFKQYSIAYGAANVDWQDFEPAVLQAEAALPRPALNSGRPGVGFCIAHRGRTALYLVLAWWDNENELPVRVFVRGLEPQAGWRPARGSESMCVWDLQVVAFERDAYVGTVLGPAGGGADAVEAYLEAVLRREPSQAPAHHASTAAAR